jgi:hypothetical protein
MHALRSLRGACAAQGDALRDVWQSRFFFEVSTAHLIISSIAITPHGIHQVSLPYSLLLLQCDMPFLILKSVTLKISITSLTPAAGITFTSL